eukprot:6175921-Pleurochrysis_carterae.AAC.2
MAEALRTCAAPSSLDPCLSDLVKQNEATRRHDDASLEAQSTFAGQMDGSAYSASKTGRELAMLRNYESWHLGSPSR